MNTLAWIGAEMGCGWLAKYCFNTLNDQFLGIICVFLMIVFLVQIFIALQVDWAILFKGGNVENE